MKSAADKLKGRQREILELLAEGMERKEIADKLGISAGTLDVYITRMYRRLGVSSPASALATFIRQSHPRLALF